MLFVTEISTLKRGATKKTHKCFLVDTTFLYNMVQRDFKNSNRKFRRFWGLKNFFFQCFRLLGMKEWFDRKETTMGLKYSEFHTRCKKPEVPGTNNKENIKSEIFRKFVSNISKTRSKFENPIRWKDTHCQWNTVRKIWTRHVRNWESYGDFCDRIETPILGCWVFGSKKSHSERYSSAHRVFPGMWLGAIERGRPGLQHIEI